MRFARGSYWGLRLSTIISFRPWRVCPAVGYTYKPLCHTRIAWFLNAEGPAPWLCGLARRLARRLARLTLRSCLPTIPLLMNRLATASSAAGGALLALGCFLGAPVDVYAGSAGPIRAFTSLTRSSGCRPSIGKRDDSARECARLPAMTPRQPGTTTARANLPRGALLV
jgi:hypothetical protein